MTLPTEKWVEVCAVQDLLPATGVRALVDSKQVAVFRLADGSIHALDAFDPFSGAPVLSRGIIGDLKGELVVASPVYKQHFRLTDGICIEDDSVSVPVYGVNIIDNKIFVSETPRCT